MALEKRPEKDILYYEVGVRIGALSLPRNQGIVLPWILVDNRPFLRCLKGFGLSLWSLGRFREAAEVFERGLRLDPMDSLGGRFCLQAVRSGTAREDFQASW